MTKYEKHKRICVKFVWTEKSMSAQLAAEDSLCLHTKRQRTACVYTLRGRGQPVSTH